MSLQFMVASSITMTDLQPTPREAKLQALFLHWVADDAGRSLGALARKNKVPISEMVKHAQKFKWQKRLAEITNNAAERTDGIITEAMVDINKRQLNILRGLQVKGFEYLRTCIIDKPSDAIKMVLASIELERKVLGLGERTEDVATVMVERLKELEEGKKKQDPQKLEFEFDPEFVAEDLGDDEDDENSPET